MAFPSRLMPYLRTIAIGEPGDALYLPAAVYYPYAAVGDRRYGLICIDEAYYIATICDERVTVLTDVPAERPGLIDLHTSHLSLRATLNELPVNRSAHP